MLLSCGWRPSGLWFRVRLSCGPGSSGRVSCGWSSCGFRWSELWSCARVSCAVRPFEPRSCALESCGLWFCAPLPCALLSCALLFRALLSCGSLFCVLLFCALLSCAVFRADGLSAWITLMVIGGVGSHTYLIPHNTSIGRSSAGAPWRTCPYGLADPTARRARASPSQFADGNERHETVADIERQNVKGARMLAAYWRRQGVEIGPNGDPTKALRAKLGPNGLPRGYRGNDAIPG